MNLTDLLLGPSSASSDAVALETPRGRWTYGRLAGVTARAAAALASAGLEPGARVAVVGPGDERFVVAYLAVLHAGGVAVPLNPEAPPPELARQLVVVEPALLVGPDAPGVLEATRAAGGPDGARPVVLADDPDVEPAPRVERDDGDLAALLFSAGTAGPPRAAMLTHGCLAANVRQVLDHPGLRVRPDDVCLAALPLFHVYGLNVVLGVGLAAGATVVLVPEFEPGAVLELVRRHGVTVLAGVPPMYRSWLDLSARDAPADAFAGVRLAVSGAAPLPVATAEAMRERFGLVVHEGYGLTEASPIVTTTAVAGRAPAGSIGPPLPGVEVRLVDVDGADVLIGDPGEVWVRGPNVFAGYWRDPEATASVLTADGWLRTGDVAVVDDDGFLRLVDRAKDLVIVSGFNVYPAEVEGVLREHPDVADAAVVGTPSERTGETVVAAVVPVPGRTVDPATLAAWSGERLARYKVPTVIEVVDELPRTIAGKVLRRELRAAHVHGPDRRDPGR